MVEDDGSSKVSIDPPINRSLNRVRKSAVSGEGSLESLIAFEWKIIDELWDQVRKAKYDKHRGVFYQNLASHANTLARLLKLAGVKTGESQDLARLLQKIAKKARRLARAV